MKDNKNEALKSDNGYLIKSHGGIGDELGEDETREKPRHNLSGSCHELQILINGQALRILIDVGAYQGRGKLERNIKAVSEGVSVILLTHPHMDHIGDFPRIFTEGSTFNGRVFSTLGTRNAAEVALVDAAKILEREYEKKYAGWQKTTQEVAAAFYAIKTLTTPHEKRVARKSNGNRMAETGSIVDKKTELDEAYAILKQYGIQPEMTEWKKEMKEREPEKPAYTIEDVYTALSSIETHSIGGWKELVPGQVAFRFYNAGHIIGSVSILFRITQDKKSEYILFSGDIGSYKWDMHPTGVANPPHNLPIKTVMIESTYGSKIREDFDVGLAHFRANLLRDLAKYRRITISTFSMDRTQNILARIIKMKLAGEIDADIVLDSPTATKHTQAYVEATRYLDEILTLPKASSIRRMLGEDFIERERVCLEEFAKFIDPANGYYIIMDKDNRDEQFGRDNEKKMIVLTASGMAEGGMVMEHLKKNIGDPTTVFYFPGYLVPGTLGYALAYKGQPGGQQKRVLIEGEKYEVKARMKQFNFLSGHGDAEDLRAWLLAMKLPKDANILVVHGDVNGSSLEFKHSLERHGGGLAGKNIIVPGLGEENFFPLDIPLAKKGGRIRKTDRGPLVVSPAPVRPKMSPPSSKEKKGTTDGVDTSGIQRKKDPIEKKQTSRVAITVGKRIFSERKGMAKIHEGKMDEYRIFIDNLIELPIPFLQGVRKYYQDNAKLEELNTALVTEKNKLKVYERRLFENEKMKKKGEKNTQANLNDENEIYKKNCEVFKSAIQSIEEEIRTLKTSMSIEMIHAKISAKALSRGIIESLGYTTTQISPHSEIVHLDSVEEVNAIAIDTLMRIVEKDALIIDNSIDFQEYKRILSIQPDSAGDYSPEEKTLLEKFQKIDTKSALDQQIIILLEKIRPEYLFVPKIRKATPRKKTPPPAKVSPKKEEKIKETSQKKGVSIITSLEDGRKIFSQYYVEKIDSLGRDKLKLEEVKRAIEAGHTPSRGKYKDFSLDEIEGELIKKTKEIAQCRRSLREKKGLIDDPEKYGDILKQIQEQNQKRKRIR